MNMELIIKKCLNCNSSFTPCKTCPSQKFCSRKCGHKHWTENNREKHNKSVRIYRKKRYQKEGQWRDDSPKAKELKNWMIELKSKPCNDCNNSFDICCMDFDHKDGTAKSYNVGSMFAHHYSRELIEIEIAKCDLVCSNCHRIRTKNRRTGSGSGGTP